MTDKPNNKIDIVAGLEMHCTHREYTFDMVKHKDGFEVLLLRNGEPRRMALCAHENDAQTILDALQFAQREMMI